MTTTEQTNHPVIALSDEATAKVAQLLTEEGEEGLGLRVAVRAGGCSGFSYEMFFDGFSIDNPNARRSCGCGQSFS